MYGLRQLIGETCVVLSIDDLCRFVHPERRNDWLLFSLTRVLAESAAAFASDGSDGLDVVVDTVFERADCRDLLLRRFRPFRTLLVRVDCPLNVLIARESARRNRPRGRAVDQVGRVHAACSYDLEIDTSVHSPDECARLVETNLR